MLTPQALAAALGLPPPTREQAEVIAAPARSALVVAGAGAGELCNGVADGSGLIAWLTGIVVRIVVDDRPIAGAAAEIAGQRIVDGVEIGLLAACREGVGRHHEARGAEAALRGVRVGHRHPEPDVLERMQQHVDVDGYRRAAADLLEPADQPLAQHVQRAFPVFGDRGRRVVQLGEQRPDAEPLHQPRHRGPGRLGAGELPARQLPRRQ